MRIAPSLALPLALLLAESPVRAQEAAQPPVDGTNPRAIVNMANSFGAATLTVQTDGNPKVVGQIAGLGYTIYLLNCTEAKGCTGLNFYIGFLDTKPDLEKINAWNATKRFGRAYLDPDGDAALEMDVTLTGGISTQNLAADFSIWRLLLDQFTAYIGFK